jgi:hypothetical protein
MSVEPEVVFNMDLANGPTSERFCREAASVLDYEWKDSDEERTQEGPDEAADYWTQELSDAGYYVWWSAGDVVVYNLNNLSDEDRETFLSEMEGL